MRTTELVIEWRRRVKIAVKGLDNRTTAIVLIAITFLFVIGACMIVFIPIWMAQ